MCLMHRTGTRCWQCAGQESEARCAAKQAEVAGLKQRLAELQQGPQQPIPETSSSELATASAPSAPMSPRGSVSFWLKDLGAGRHGAATQPPSASVGQAGGCQGGLGPSQPPLPDAARGGTSLHHQSAMQSTAVAHNNPVPAAADGSHTRTDHAPGSQPAGAQGSGQLGLAELHSGASDQMQALQAAHARISMLQAENERLMEVGNQLRAQQHRLEIEADRSTAAELAADAWLPALVSAAAAARAGRVQPASGQHQEPAQLQHALPESTHASASSALDGRTAQQHSLSEPGLQPFHPDYGRQRQMASTVHHLPRARPASTPGHEVDQDQDNSRPGEPGRQQPGQMEPAGPAQVADNLADEVAERLRRIEALTERIAQSQLLSSTPSPAGPPMRQNHRVPGQLQVPRNQHGSTASAPPPIITLALEENAPPSPAAAGRAASPHKMQPNLPARTSARSTASQRAKLQLLHQKHAQASKPTVRNWNNPDPEH